MMRKFRQPSTIIAMQRKYHENNDDEGFDRYTNELTMLELIALKEFSEMTVLACRETIVERREEKLRNSLKRRQNREEEKDNE